MTSDVESSDVSKPPRLTHVDAKGSVRMVDVGSKPATLRRAIAVGKVRCSPETVDLLRAGELAKGDALAVARIAGIAAAKRTPDLIPLCHPIAITGVDVDVELVAEGVAISAEVRTADRTGIEMEALTCVSVAALNVIDMIKAVDRGAYIDSIYLERKEGGASGTWSRVPSETFVSPPVHQLQGVTGVVTVSDRAAAGLRADETGPLIVKALTDWGTDPVHLTVSDDAPQIAAAVRDLIERGAWLIITTGGTGITSSDVTPQAIAPLLDTELPALAAEIAAAGVGKAPGALLSRAIAGVIGHSAVITLPGSPGGVHDGLEVLAPVVSHLADQLEDGDH